MKSCPSCGEVKDLSLFSKASRRSDGHQGFCKLCNKEYHKTNKILIRKKRRMRYHNDIDESRRKQNLYGRSYRKTKKSKEYKSNYYQTHK